jgi:hypothetical protein
MKYKYLAISGLFVICLFSCKKETMAPNNSALIVGKWYFKKDVSVTYQNNKEIGTSTTTDYTNEDFVEYYNDGSGYFSESTSQGPSLSEFKYSIMGSTLTQFSSVENAGTPETITSISTTALSIHVVSLVPDDNDPTITDTEIDDLTFTK